MFKNPRGQIIMAYIHYSLCLGRETQLDVSAARVCRWAGKEQLSIGPVWSPQNRCSLSDVLLSREAIIVTALKAFGRFLKAKFLFYTASVVTQNPRM